MVEEFSGTIIGEEFSERSSLDLMIEGLTIECSMGEKLLIRVCSRVTHAKTLQISEYTTLG